MSLPTTVAHEGNPRTDSLTVSGTLDQTPTITPPSPSPDPSVEPPQSDPDPIGGINNFDCTDVMIEYRNMTTCGLGFVIDQYDPDSVSIAGKLIADQPSCGAFGAVAVTIDSAFDMTVFSADSEPFGGMAIVYPVVAPGDDPLVNGYNELYFTYAGAVNGLPISGLAMFVASDSTVCDFSGIVCLVDHVTNQSVVGYYQNANLRTDSPVTLATGNLATAGSFVYSFASLSGSTITIEMGDSTGILISTTVSTDYVTPTNNLGLVWIGHQSSGVHSAQWTQWSGSNWTVV